MSKEKSSVEKQPSKLVLFLFGNMKIKIAALIAAILLWLIFRL